MILGRTERFAGTNVISFQVGIGFLGGNVFFQMGLCTLLRTMICRYGIIKMDFENTAVIEQNIEIDNQKLINYKPK